jgi:hypothetical protein
MRMSAGLLGERGCEANYPLLGPSQALQARMAPGVSPDLPISTSPRFSRGPLKPKADAA